ncbi:MAG: hypothetical protein ACRYFX_20910 [Janthinobacterium lividum]
MTSYSQVTFEILRDELKISARRTAFLPVTLALQPLPSWLTAYLAVVSTSSTLAKTEKSLSESLIAPVLHAVRESNASRITLFSGEPLYHDDLGGVCDFIIAAQPDSFLPDPPIVILVEAKKLDLLAGIPQCVAEMRTGQRLNERAGRSGPIYGCVTIGTDWIFLKLEGDQALIDPTIFFSSQLSQVLAVFQWMIDQFG